MKKILLVIGLVFLLLGCTSPQEIPKNQTNTTPTPLAKIAQNGDMVSVDYIGTLDNGTVFDTSLESTARQNNLPIRPSYAPLSFKVGTGQMISGFDKAVVGMKEGEEKTVRLTPSEAYGEISSDRIIVVEISQIQGGENLEMGGMIQSNTGAIGRITSIKDGNATIDFNHELAGKALNFKIIMKSIQKSG